MIRFKFQIAITLLSILALHSPPALAADPVREQIDAQNRQLAIDKASVQGITEGNPPKTEKVTYLGVTAKSVDATLRAQLDLPEDTGLTVTTVDHKGPAGADVHVNDVLQKLDDQILIDPHQLVTLIHLHKPGDTVTLTIIRAAKPIQVTIKLGEKERTVPAADPDHTADLNNPAPPDDQHPAFDPHIPFGPNNQVAMAFSDGTYSANVKPDPQGRLHIIVKDQTGQVVEQGPVDTEAQWQKLSPDIRKHLEIMHKALGLKSK